MKALGYDDHPDVAGSIGFCLRQARRSATRRGPGTPRRWPRIQITSRTLGNSGALYVAQGDIAKARGDLDRIKAACGSTSCREYRELESLIAAKGR